MIMIVLWLILSTFNSTCDVMYIRCSKGCSGGGGGGGGGGGYGSFTSHRTWNIALAYGAQDMVLLIIS